MSLLSEALQKVGLGGDGTNFWTWAPPQVANPTYNTNQTVAGSSEPTATKLTMTDYLNGLISKTVTAFQSTPTGQKLTESATTAVQKDVVFKGFTKVKEFITNPFVIGGASLLTIFFLVRK